MSSINKVTLGAKSNVFLRERAGSEGISEVFPRAVCGLRAYSPAVQFRSFSFYTKDRSFDFIVSSEKMVRMHVFRFHAQFLHHARL